MSRTLKVPVLNMVGSLSPFVDESVTLNGKLNPVHASWMKIQVRKGRGLGFPTNVARVDFSDGGGSIQVV